MKNIFITGKTGVGKTYRAKQLFEEAKKDWANIKSTKHPLDRIEDHYKLYNASKLLLEARVPHRAIELVTEATRAHYVVIDDIGVTRNPEWSPDIIYLIINERLEKQRSTVITSNLSIKDIAELIDERLASRLAMFEIINIVGEDLRLKNK